MKRKERVDRRRSGARCRARRHAGRSGDGGVGDEKGGGGGGDDQDGWSKTKDPRGTHEARER
ncbi:MAG: hypothetical protein E6J28_02755 [Chloroflexi bacterium]|nr:MAG: hypothetical protein E6J28_02755 [Chloroflexota bacterium]